jgi:hypothetical protein
MIVMDALVLSLPTRNSTVRMRVWRALKDTGCGVLRDGVYLLPAGSAGRPVLAGLESEIRSAGGFAMTVELKLTSAQLKDVRKLFDRSADYGALVHKVRTAKSSLSRLGHRKARTTLSRLKRSFDKLSAIDFFPGQASLQAAEAISALDRTLQELYSQGEPHPSPKQRLRRLDRSKYQKRVWATRRDLWVDRLASAWLIKRFIDAEARFAWIDQPRNRPKNAVGFDFDGAEFTHTNSRVTFEVLLTSFSLENDPALAAIGAAVHFLDIGGIPVSDARGLETVLNGVKGKARNDDELLSEAGRILDLVYCAYGQNRGKQSTASTN